MASRALKIDPKPSKQESTTTAAQTESIQNLKPEEIATRSYELWQERGCPIGSPEVDWFQAEEELRNRRTRTRTAE